MSGHADGVRLVQSAAERGTPTPGDLEAGTSLVQTVAAKLVTPLLAAHPSSNVAFSPLSITLALGMLRAGAQGESAAELDTLFGVDGSASPPALDAVDQRLTELDEGDVQLSLANAFVGPAGNHLA